MDTHRRISSQNSLPRLWTDLADPTGHWRPVELGQHIVLRDQQTPEALGAFQKAEIEKWWPVIKAAGIKVE
jgi:hypothetical protein